jgi:hypothetical protein
LQKLQSALQQQQQLGQQSNQIPVAQAYVVDQTLYGSATAYPTQPPVNPMSPPMMPAYNMPAYPSPPFMGQPPMPIQQQHYPPNYLPNHQAQPYPPYSPPLSQPMHATPPLMPYAPPSNAWSPPYANVGPPMPPMPAMPNGYGQAGYPAHPQQNIYHAPQPSYVSPAIPPVANGDPFSNLVQASGGAGMPPPPPPLPPVPPPHHDMHVPAYMPPPPPPPPLDF